VSWSARHAMRVSVRVALHVRYFVLAVQAEWVCVRVWVCASMCMRRLAGCAQWGHTRTSVHMCAGLGQRAGQTRRQLQT